jgi:hypothetical protein
MCCIVYGYILSKTKVNLPFEAEDEVEVLYD